MTSENDIAELNRYCTELDLNLTKKQARELEWTYVDVTNINSQRRSYSDDNNQFFLIVLFVLLILFLDVIVK